MPLDIGRKKMAALTASALLLAVVHPSRVSRSHVEHPRSVCRRCRRPARQHCVCAELPPAPIAVQTRVLILQHPRESRKAMCSVPLIPLCLREAEVVQAPMPFEAESCFTAEGLEPLQRSIREGYEPLLLFPGEGAVPLDAAAGWPQPRASSKQSSATRRSRERRRKLLVLIDGTWSQARAMMRHSPSLAAACTLVMFERPAQPIIAAVRREPERHCVSTLEACARALRLVEPTPAAEEAAAAMERGLRALVGRQLAAAEADRRPRYWRRAEQPTAETAAGAAAGPTPGVGGGGCRQGGASCDTEPRRSPGDESRSARFAEGWTDGGWTEVSIRTGAPVGGSSPRSAAAALSRGDSVLLLPGVGAPAECEAVVRACAASLHGGQSLVRLPSIAAAQLASSSELAFEWEPAADAPLTALPAEADELCARILRRALFAVDQALAPVSVSQFGTARVSALLDAGELEFAEREPAVNVYSEGGAFHPHCDQQGLTVLVPLSAGHGGGGTGFWAREEATGRGGGEEAADGEEEGWEEEEVMRRAAEPATAVLRPARGTALLFSGDVLHAGLPVQRGSRVVLVASFSGVRFWPDERHRPVGAPTYSVLQAVSEGDG